MTQGILKAQLGHMQVMAGVHLDEIQGLRRGIQAIIITIQAAETAGVELDPVDIVARLKDVLGDDNGV